jgi:ENTH domain-containing protein
MVFKGALRAVKNVTNGYSDAEAKVRTVTSNDGVIPSGAQMHELAQLSYNQCVPSPRGPRSTALLTLSQRGFC